MVTISIVLPNLCGGGAERLHINLARQWISQGYSVEMVLMQATGVLMPLLPAEVSIYNLGVTRISKTIISLARYIRKRRPAVVLAAMWSLTSATAIAWNLAGRSGRLFLSEHEHLTQSYINRKRVSPFYIRNLIRFTYPLASGIITVSRGVMDDLHAIGSLAMENMNVIYNPSAIGISCSSCTPEEKQSVWGNNIDHCILAVGRLSEEKDLFTLVRAFALVSKNINTKLIILGEGPLRAELTILINSLGLHESIILPGFVTNPSPWYRSADLFVISSKWEGFGNVIVEALEYGIPIVSTDCPSGPAEILDNGKYGKLVPVGDVDALAAAMLASLNESHDREKLMERAKDFSVEKIAREYLEYFLSRGAKI